MLSQRDGGRGVRCKFEGGKWGKGICTQDTGSQGAGGGGGWAGGGGQKADHQGFREQRPDTWSWGVGVGPKRETRGAIGDPRVRDGGTRGTRGKAGLSAGWGQRAGVGAVGPPQGVTPLSLLPPQISVLPPPNPDSLNVTDNGSYCEEWGPRAYPLFSAAQGSGEGYPSPLPASPHNT